ncbi:response regulator [Candidatus Chlorohelix sp.]|uniref:response regulator n=1 Tax=Candidatus Chlorohelix sp. TaxID=3139201 RepID=UPI00305A2484
MIKAIVVDDEWLTLEEIKDLVNATGFIRVGKTYENPLIALAEAATSKAEVAFIDIEMPEMDGITLGEKLLEINPALHIVFITAYNQYAIQAFEINALDYILKPVNTERFNKMTQRLKIARSNKALQVGVSLKIKCFDRLVVSIGDKEVKWKRSKAEELFAFLLIHQNERIHKDTIIEQLWSEYEPNKATPILQTSVCKIRNIFASFARNKVALEFSGGCYCLKIDECECDYFEVVKALDRFQKEDNATYSAIEKAASLYKAGLLTQHGYHWAIDKGEDLKNRLYQTLKYLAEYYASISDNEDAISILEKLLILTPHDEESNNKLLEAYAKSNKRSAIIKHFQWLERVLKNDYDMTPAASTSKLFQKLCQEKYK